MHVPHRFVDRTISTLYITTTTTTTTIIFTVSLLLLFGQGALSMRLPIQIVSRTFTDKLSLRTTTKTRTQRNIQIVKSCNTLLFLSSLSSSSSSSYIPQQRKQRYYNNHHHLSLSLYSTFETTSSTKKRARTFLQRYPKRTLTSKLLFSTNNNMSTNDKDTTTSKDTTTTSSTDTKMIIGPILPPLSKNLKRIFWIRHGEVINPGGTKSVYYGSQDVLLSEFGKNEAILAGQYLSQYTLNHTNVYSSTLSRAIYGATQVINYQQTQNNQNNNNDLNLIQLKELIELDRGEWCGLTIDEIGRDAMKEFDNCNESVTPIGGESYSTVYTRVIDGLNNKILSSMLPGTCTAVVSHLQVTRCIVAHALNIPLYDMVSKINIATASITCIDYNDNTDNDSNNTCTVHYQSFKPSSVIEELQKQRTSIDNAN